MRVRNLSAGTTLRCNLDCLDCYTQEKRGNIGSDDVTDIPLETIEIMASLTRPINLELVGPGETTLWREGNKDFNDLVLTFNEISPETQILLLSNSTYVPDGEWKEHVNKVLLSIDAPDRETYQAVKRRDRFGEALDGLREYMRSPVERVWPKYVIRRQNIEQIPQFLALMKSLYDEFDDRRGDRFEVRFVEVSPKYDNSQATDEQMESMRGTVERLRREMDPEFLAHTNLDTLFEGREELDVQNPCYLLLTDASLSLEGEFGACQRKFGSGHRLGNIYDPPEVLVRNRWKLFAENPCHEQGKPCPASYLVRRNRIYQEEFGGG